MNRIKILIIGVIVVILIFIFLIVSLLFSPSSNPPNDNTGAITPTRALFNEKELYITSITPLDTTRSYLPPQPLKVTFTQSVLPTSFKYTTTPQTELLIVPGNTPSSLVVAPRTSWQAGTTTVSILEATTSTSGKVLKNPQSYTIKIAVPTIPIVNEGAY